MKFEIDSENLTDGIVSKLLEELKPMIEKSKSVEDKIFTVKTLAEYLDVKNQWVYERVRNGEIPHNKLRKFLRFKKSVIDEWFDKQNIPVVKKLSRQNRR